LKEAKRDAWPLFLVQAIAESTGHGGWGLKVKAIASSCFSRHWQLGEKQFLLHPPRFLNLNARIGKNAVFDLAKYRSTGLLGDVESC
jgi:hypothetical protein